ncbi:hypothetical protein KSP40_PGU001283 [Platanthera guangdongensis]|uniref:Uncharacterized protein n=1 Tax=Platanthera guangdongensis TaxID=2320717 RepID=A0ABR2LSY1_9ASPA
MEGYLKVFQTQGRKIFVRKYMKRTFENNLWKLNIGKDTEKKNYDFSLFKPPLVKKTGTGYAEKREYYGFTVLPAEVYNSTYGLRFLNSGHRPRLEE